MLKERYLALVVQSKRQSTTQKLQTENKRPSSTGLVPTAAVITKTTEIESKLHDTTIQLQRLP